MKSIISIIIAFFFILIKTSFAQPRYVIPDFQVNENTGWYYADQSESQIASDCNGNFTITWIDERNFYENIYFQRFSSEGKRIGDNINITNYIDNYSFGNPSIAMDANGFIVIAWFEERGDSFFISSKRYSEDGTEYGDRLDIPLQNYAAYLNVEIDSSGTYLISWINRQYDEFNEKWKSIEAQRFTYEGNLLGDRIIIADEFVNASYYKISIAAKMNEGFIAVWNSRLNSESSVYFRQFNNSGEKIGGIVKVIDSTDEAVNANPWNPDVAVDDDGNFLIVWEDFRLPLNQSIFAQRYSSLGERLGNNFKVNTNVSESTCFEPSVSYSKEGEFVVAWDYSYGFLKSMIKFQRISNAGIRINGNKIVNELTDSTEHYQSAITTDCNGRFIISWTLSKVINGNYNSDVYFKMYDENGEPRDASILVNDDDGIPSAIQYDPDIGVFPNGDFIITWVDERNTNADIFAQKISKEGNFIGQNYKVNSDSNYGVLNPMIAINDNGIYLIVWGSYNPPDYKIMGQLYSIDGNPINDNILIVENIIEFFHSYDILADAEGNFIIVWKHRTEAALDYTKLFTRRISNSGELISDISLIDSNYQNLYEFEPVLERIGQNYIVTWHGWKGDSVNASLYSQIYSMNGAKIGDRILVQENDKYTFSADPSVVSNIDGSFSIGFTYSNNLIHSYVVQRFSIDGWKIGVQKAIPNIYGSNEYWKPIKLSYNNKDEYIITFYSENNYEARKFDTEFNQIDDAIKIADSSTNNNNGFISILVDNRLYTTWTTTIHPWYARDIWANVIDLAAVTSTSSTEEEATLPSDLVLFQNYPNPFNPSTTIKYSIPSSSVMLNSFQQLNNAEIPKQVRDDIVNVTLKVYDILGREVATLVNQKQKPGNYEVVFNTNNHSNSSAINSGSVLNLTSGIYFYRLAVDDFVQTKKMILLK